MGEPTERNTIYNTYGINSFSLANDTSPLAQYLYYISLGGHIKSTKTFGTRYHSLYTRKQPYMVLACVIVQGFKHTMKTLDPIESKVL